jgi:ABC-type hemin transport system ATPase subunit
MCVLELAARRAVMPQAMILALPFTEVAFLGASVPGLAARSPERRVAERLNGLSEAARARKGEPIPPCSGEMLAEWGDSVLGDLRG